jgi:hypothetical protein
MATSMTLRDIFVIVISLCLLRLDYVVCRQVKKPAGEVRYICRREKCNQCPRCVQQLLIPLGLEATRSLKRGNCNLSLPLGFTCKLHP